MEEKEKSKISLSSWKRPLLSIYYPSTR